MYKKLFLEIACDHEAINSASFTLTVCLWYRWETNEAALIRKKQTKLETRLGFTVPP